MESYIHLYEKNSEFIAAYNGPDYKEPWLSLTEENMTISYNKPKLTAITFDSIAWVKDVPATGGTATKDNCTYTIMAKYIGSEPKDITLQVNNVTGELHVEETTATTRHEAGQLTLTASYSGFTATGNVTVYQEAVPDFSTEPLTFNILSAGTIIWRASNTSIAKTIDYKLNNGEWTSITSNTSSSAPTITVNSGDKIQFRGDNTQYATNTSRYNSFRGSTASFEVEGNIMSLIYGDKFKDNSTISSAYTFTGLFSECVNLVSAENLILPATTLESNCYKNMFSNCTSLTTAPELPATTLADNCYNYMFNGCTSLTTAPALPATTLKIECYSGMFWNCTSLTTVPSNLLPATTLASSCYFQMFYGCTSLTKAPELPATTLAKNCYSGMFSGCLSLNYIKCLATDISATDCTYSWVRNVASKGTFVKASSMTGWRRGNNGIPTGWTEQDA